MPGINDAFVIVIAQLSYAIYRERMLVHTVNNGYLVTSD